MYGACKTKWTGTKRKAECPTRSSYKADIIIIGAGPAGLNAAIAASASGAKVVVIDEREESGGQYFKPRTSGFRGVTKEDWQHLEGKKLRARAHKSNVRFYTGYTVWYARKENDIFELRCSSREQQVQLLSSALILCTGAFEIPTIVPGWTLPGVTTIGATQTMVRRYGVMPKGRVLIAGNGPLGLQLVHEMLKLGKSEITLTERANFNLSFSLFKTAFYSPQLFFKGLGYRLSAMKAQVPIMSGWELEKVLGSSKVEAVSIRNIKSNAKLEFPVDFIATGEGFAPQLEISRLLGVPTKVDPVSKQIIP
ncbi:MAG: FAD-dependent oxidoreductase, partial [Paracoccaceae bacterium]